MSTARITLYELHSYNSGDLTPQTFNLDLYNDHAEYQAAVTAWLATVGPRCEEWVVADSEGIPHNLLGEYDLDPSVFAYLQHPAGTDAKDAFISHRGSWDVAQFDESYVGEWISETDYAYEHAERHLNIPEDIQCYFNYDALAYDIFINDYYFNDGHVFRR